jgi:MFS family permease
MFKHLEKLDQKKLKLVVITSFFITFEAALLAYTNSSFVEQFLPIKYLGYIFVIAHLIASSFILSLTRWIVRFGKYKVLIHILVLHLVSLVSLVFATNPFWAISLFILYNVTLFVSYVGFDIFTETFSCDDRTGEIKGKQLVIKSCAYVISPIITGFVLQHYGFNSLFALTAVIVFVAIIVFIHLKGDYQENEIKNGFKNNIYQALKNKNIFNILLIAFWLSAFYAVMIIYMPLHLRQLGFEWSQIGLIFTVMLLAFVFFQYPAGVLADKKYGEKGMLMIGLFIAGITTFSVFYLETKTLWVWMLLLFINRTGACLVDVMTESYFFKQIDCTDVYLINFLHTMRSFAFIITPLIVSLILMFYPLKYVFVCLGIFMILGLFIAGKLQNTK